MPTKVHTITSSVPGPQAYQDRAANNPIPYLVPEHQLSSLVLHEPAQGQALASAGQAYWTDVSEYQSPYTSAYPYPIASFRFHSGYRIDNQAVANWSYHRDAIERGQTRILIVYAVFIPGQLQTVLLGLYQVFGAVCPSNRLVLMIDMESGSGFAGPGNHSDEANRWAQAFADYTGTSSSWARSVGYANHGDWQGNWPGVDPRLKDITAAYNNADPTPWAWQYAGGNPAYPVPAGAPRNCAPWTTIYIDMNLAHFSIDELEQQFEIAQSSEDEDEMQTLLFHLPPNNDPGNPPGCQQSSGAAGYYMGFIRMDDGTLMWASDNALGDALKAAGKAVDAGQIGWSQFIQMLWLHPDYGPGGTFLAPSGTNFGAGPGQPIPNGVVEDLVAVPIPGVKPAVPSTDNVDPAEVAKELAADTEFVASVTAGVSPGASVEDIGTLLDEKVPTAVAIAEAVNNDAAKRMEA